MTSRKEILNKVKGNQPEYLEAPDLTVLGTQNLNTKVLLETFITQAPECWKPRCENQ